MAWSWVGSQLSGMAAGEFKKLNTNTPFDVALARTRANFDAGSTWANDAAVASAIKAANLTNMGAYSGPTINFDTGEVVFAGAGHGDSGDGSHFSWSTSTLAWSLSHKSCMYDSSGPHTVTCNITAITAGTPPRLTVDADIAVDGDQGVITGTTDADGTYQLVRVDSTHVDLYNLDGTYSQRYTAFSGGSLTDSTGTLTITVGTNTVDGSNYYAYPNADGDQMPPALHTYHRKWIGDNRYLLSGSFVFDGGTGGGQSRRFWIWDKDATPEVYRGYHDPTGSEPTADAQTNFGGPWYNGPIAYDTVLKRLYGFSSEGTLKNFNYRVNSWEAGQNSDTDFQRVYSLEFDGSNGAQQGYDALTMPQPGATSNRALFALHSTTEFNFCTDLGGTPTMSVNTFSDGAIFQTDMTGVDAIGACYDDLNDEIIYWGGGATIGAITTSSTLSAWTTAEVTSSPTGDTPSQTGYPTNSACAICKVPDCDAYLLARGGEVWLYARSAIAVSGNPSYYYHQQNVVTQ